jgi:hypothetical protein
MPAWERGVVEPIRSVQRVVETPVAWLRTTLGISQQWSLYQNPAPDRFRMAIEGQAEDRSWHMLYRAGDPDHTEDAALIEHARVWGTWDPTDKPTLEYSAFAGWITGRMLERHAELVAARVTMEPIAIVPGGYRSSGPVRWTYVRTRNRR